MTESQSTETSIALLQSDMTQVKKTLDEINTKLDNKYVTKESHEVVVQDVELLKKIAFGIIGFICVTVIGAVVYNVLKKQ